MSATKSLGQAGVTIEAPGAELFARRLRKWGQAIENAKPAFELMLPKLRQSEGQIFDSNGVAFGHPWAGAVEPERKTNSRLLEASGDLRRSLDSRTSESVQDATSVELRFSTRVPYAHFHEYGTSRMVARPFVGMTNDIRRAVTEIMHDYSVAQSQGRE